VSRGLICNRCGNQCFRVGGGGFCIVLPLGSNAPDQRWDEVDERANVVSHDGPIHSPPPPKRPRWIFVLAGIVVAGLSVYAGVALLR
jgi:hypothetical protein